MCDAFPDMKEAAREQNAELEERRAINEEIENGMHVSSSGMVSRPCSLSSWWCPNSHALRSNNSLRMNS